MKGIGSFCRAGPWASEKARPINFKAQKRGLQYLPNNKIFRPRKIRLTRTDVGMNFSCSPQAPKLRHLSSGPR